MRWITFLILLYLMSALESARFAAIPHGATDWPAIEFLPLLAAFYALYAAESAAPLAALACGSMVDMGNHDFLGTSALPLALMAWLILRVRLFVVREHFISQMLATFVLILGYAVLSAFFRKILGASLDGGGMFSHVAYLWADAVYTALLAPVFFWIFFRFKDLLGFSLPGARSRGR
jgi:rod shape-determining protein MreD